MPKSAKISSKLLNDWISKFPEGVYTTDGNLIYCHLNAEDALSIQRSQEAFNSPIIQQHLAYIHANFSILPKAIKQLETQGLTLAQQLDILADVKTTLASAGGPVGQGIRTKLEKVLDANPGLGKMIEIAKVLTGGESHIKMAPDMIAAMKFAPLTSCDVERSFSVYKNILADNRTSFTPENLEKYLICNCEKRE